MLEHSGKIPFPRFFLGLNKGFASFHMLTPPFFLGASGRRESQAVICMRCRQSEVVLEPLSELGGKEQQISHDLIHQVSARLSFLRLTSV